MVDYAQLDEGMAEEMVLFSYRLKNLKQVIKFYVHCLENEEYVESIVELYCFGYMLNEYLGKTVANFDEIQKKLNIYP